MSPLRRALALAVILAGALAPAARADFPFPPSQWYGLPGLNEASGAQWVRAIAHGTPPGIVYAGLEGGGVYRSIGGAAWTSFNSGFPNPLTTNVRALLTSSTGTTVYAGTDDGITSRRAARGSRTRRAPRTTRPSRRSSTSPCSHWSASPAAA